MASSFRGSRYGIVLLLILADVAVISGTSVRGWTYLRPWSSRGRRSWPACTPPASPWRTSGSPPGSSLVAIASVALTRVHAGDDPGAFARAVNGAARGRRPGRHRPGPVDAPAGHRSHRGRGALRLPPGRHALLRPAGAGRDALPRARLPPSRGRARRPTASTSPSSRSRPPATATSRPRVGAARALAVLEALIGQLYLVTVVAVLVSRVGPLRRGGGA